MKNVIPLGLLLVALILTSCGDRTANLRNGASSTMSLEALSLHQTSHQLPYLLPYLLVFK
jgi:hypothetical protein